MMPVPMYRTLPTALLLAALILTDPRPAQADPPPRDPYVADPLPKSGPRPTWRRRLRPNVKGMKGRGGGLMNLKRWPAEPAAPATVDEKRFALALKELCHDWMPPKRPYRYARWILESAKEFSVDPFLIGGLLFRQSRCLPRQKNDYGIGVAMINLRMHGPYLRKRRYQYWVLEGGAWKEQHLDLKRYALVRGNLRRPQPSIYFAAAFLSIWKRQCPAIDGAFSSVPHRHFVSHFMWGDRVKGAGAEDRVLRARRRLLAYYTRASPTPRAGAVYQGQALVCPMDAPPRKVTSAMGQDRDGGSRRHKGVDFGSTWGEPVRAVADGKVYFAGVARKGAPGKRVDPAETAALKRKEMGPAGLFVMIRHANGLASGYMHLSSYVVKTGQQVKAGDLVGRVGRTGIKKSGPHLHFELRVKGRHIDPAPHLAPYIFMPHETYRGKVVIAEEKRRRNRRRAKRWRNYKEQLKQKRARQKGQGHP